ncbi:GFA family protein [Marinobacterium arenosum]|uniref:GFA family protein n=1 Tax=Marinobacterium arenosum TaxID=2862496 RepID=UPI001C962593|nr:GFA family protein [Marinobacterium arenosum]MBY4675372.1 GFA family protein [Marinobacterium arenosum]
MPETLTGSCLCGAIAYQIDSIDIPIGHCHCRTCQKAHAAPFASYAGVMRENFRWLRGEELLSTYESSPGKNRHFCSRCGSQLLAERVGQPHVIPRVATLDQAPGQMPQMHIWCSHDLPWLAYEDQSEHPEWPPGR